MMGITFREHHLGDCHSDERSYNTSKLILLKMYSDYCWILLRELRECVNKSTNNHEEVSLFWDTFSQINSYFIYPQ